MKRSLYKLSLPEVSLLIALLSLLSASRAGAACEPPGSAKSDTILCSETETEGVAAKSGDDQIIVLRDANLLLESSGAPSPLVAIDAGSGNDTVVHLGRLSVNVILGETSLAASSGGSEPCDSKNPPPPWDAGKSDDHKKHWTFSRSNDKSRWRCPPPPSVIKAVGIDAGEGKDVLTSDGSLSVSVSDSNGNQPVATTGIDGGNGNDVIVQTGTMTVSASSEKATGPFTLQTSGETPVPPPAGESASATAVGIAGGNGDDVVVNDGPLTVTASSKITSVTPSLSLTGGDEETSTTTAASKAVGIDAGTGKDDVTNSGAVMVTATSEVTSVHAELNLVDTSHGDAGTTIQSTAVGLDAGEGKDNVTIGNTGAITATATSKSTSVNVEVNGADAATANATLQMEATAIGIEAGRGKDAVDNRGSVTAEAKSESVEVGVNVSFVDVTIADRRPSDVSTTLQSTAIGIDGGAAKDDGAIGNTGSVTAKATSSVNSTGVSLASEGVPGSAETFFEEGSLASIGINSRSDAFGLLGGAGADRLESGGTITANSEASAHQQSINLGMTIFNWHIPTPGLVLGSAGTRAEAESTGIAGGEGGDAIVHSGLLDVDATAKSSTTVVSVNLSEFAVDILPQGVPSIPISAALVVADSTTEAAAGATGIAGGGGDDTIRNTGTITTDAVAKNGSVDVAGALGLKFEDGNEGGGTPSPGPSLSFETDVTLARAATDAVSQAAGIDGGAGHDEIINEGGVTVTAKSDTYAAAANFDILGSLEGKQGANPSILVGVAANDTSNNAVSDAVGLQGGEGDDRIANSGTTTVTANADALNVNAGVNLALDESGAMVGVSLAHSQSTATATSTGIDGGAGTDEIANTGAIDSHANADATSVAVIATIESVSSKGLTAGATVIDASTIATSNAAGIRSSAEPDNQDDKNNPEKKSCCESPDGTITNTGSVSADADATTTAVDVGATISIAKKGAALGVTLTDASATANATAQGIEADQSDNTLLNEGDVELTATSKAVAVAVDLSVEGTATGLAAGATLTRSSVTATSAATGIEGAEGNDTLVNTGSISTTARPEETDAVQSTATTVGVGVEASLAVKEGAVLGAALADTSAASTSRATGLDGGSGDDALLNQGEIDLKNVGADTTAVAVSVDLALAKSGLSIGAALAKSDATSRVTVTGLEGGQGEDALTNEGSITLRQIDAEADAVSVSLGIAGAKEGVALGGALVDAGATTTAAATALSGGDGNDTLVNTGSITGDDIKANADATGVSLQVTVAKEGLTVGAALADSDVTATSLVKGLDGGAGDDTLKNEGSVTLKNVKAEADAVSVGVGLAGAQDGVALAAGITDASGTGNATAVGLDGGAGKDKVINKGGVTIENVLADGNATGISVELAGANAGVAAGVTLADTSGLAHATAKGLDGGAGDDALWNEGTIDLKQIESDADSVSVGVTLNIAMTGLAGGAALSRAEATGETKATGIDGGEGDDFIGSKGAVTIDGVKANTDSTGVSVELGVTSSGVAVGAALADVSATADVQAKGIDGGSGDDRLYNGGPITLKNIKADADAVSVGVSLNAAIEAGVAAGVSLADGSATAEVAATGIDGGEGNDTLVNAGAIQSENVEADAHATGVSVSLNVSLAGAAAGAAIADTSGTARATVEGLDGGDGDDQIFNTESGTISVAGTAKADALSLGIGISAALGVAAGAAITDVSTTAESTVMGLDGGAGIDQIQNDGGLTATSNAQANSTSISISIPLGIGAGAALADARSTATSTAVGINDEGSPSPSAMSVSGCDEGSRCGGEAPLSRITNLGPVTSTATASS
ncbi:MAG: hypothetical protein EPO39_08125, partial [Candidatus Manganitrophaceae bacterium]